MTRKCNNHTGPLCGYANSEASVENVRFHKFFFKISKPAYRHVAKSNMLVFFNFTNTYLCIYGYTVKTCVKRPVQNDKTKS